MLGKYAEAVASAAPALPAPDPDILAKTAPAAPPPVTEAAMHPYLLASAEALLDTVDSAASPGIRLDAAEALLEFSDRLPEDYAQRAGEFLFRVVDRTRPDAVNGEPRDRVRAARLILKYGRVGDAR